MEVKELFRKLAEKIKTMGEHLIFILKKMCDAVGANYSFVNFKNENWFMEYEWSDVEEQKFVDWLSDYLYSNAKARREIMLFPVKNKERCKKTASEFIFCYGWKTKNI